MLKKHLMILLLFISLSAQVGQEEPDKQELDNVLLNMPNTEEAQSALKEALTYGPDSVKVKAIQVMAYRGNAEYYDMFRTFLGYGTKIRIVNKDPSSDISWNVRSHAAVGLAKVGNTEATPLLRRALNQEENETVQKSIVYALGELKDVEAIPYIERIVSETSDEALVIECIQAMGKIGSKEAFPKLLEIATAKTYYPLTRQEAIKALDTLNWE